MTNYYDTYLAAPDKPVLETFVRGFVNKIPELVQGRAATAERTDPDTEEYIAASDAVGDPTLFYAGVRTTVNITATVPPPLCIVDSGTGRALLGGWAE